MALVVRTFFHCDCGQSRKLVSHISRYCAINKNRLSISELLSLSIDSAILPSDVRLAWLLLARPGWAIWHQVSQGKVKAKKGTVLQRWVNREKR